MPLFSLVSEVKVLPGPGLLKSGSPLVFPRVDVPSARLQWRCEASTSFCSPSKNCSSRLTAGQVFLNFSQAP